MTHIQRDNHLIEDICAGKLHDRSFNGITLSTVAILDLNTGFDWIAHTFFIISVLAQNNRLVDEFYNAAGHIDRKRNIRSYYVPINEKM